MSERALRVMELFCGIGGVAMAVRDLDARVVASVDINQHAVECLRANSNHPTFVKEIDSIDDDWFRQWNADLWWASPPCQPYTRRGKQRDTGDPRAAPLLRLTERIDRLRPRMFAMENVPGFEISLAADRLRAMLDATGYQRQEVLLCPTELGYPNRRRRFYLVASREKLVQWPTPSLNALPRRLTSFLEPRAAADHFCNELIVDDDTLRKYSAAIDVVDAKDKDAVAGCFTSGYGRSYVRSGSFLKTRTTVRRFLPKEILGLLGFPEDYELGTDLPIRNAWRLVGNSLSVPAVKFVLRAFGL